MEICNEFQLMHSHSHCGNAEILFHVENDKYVKLSLINKTRVRSNSKTYAHKYSPNRPTATAIIPVYDQG
uniref:Uncharacterized protein n=1 Tax=Glossina austeni TaxID=7395 RepID=A0A1A9VAV1_GLOAU